MGHIEILSELGDDNFFPEFWYHFANEKHFWFYGRFKAFLEQLKSANIDIHQELQGMEIGCGNCCLIKQLEKATRWRIDGCDINRHGVTFNSVQRGTIYLYNIYERNPQFYQRYDFIVLFDVIEHIENTKEFLNSVLYHLKPGGLIFINTPALQFLYSRYDEVAGHFRRYELRSMRHELAVHDLNIIDIRYWGMSWFFLLFLRKCIVSRMDKADGDAILEKGFSPPSRWINRFFTFLVNIEMFFLKRPVLGTSLLAIAQKKALSE